MHIQIDKSYLQMSRGDTFILPLVINCGTELNFKQYNLQDDEYLYVGIMEPEQSFEDALIRKRLNKNSPKDDDGNLLFILNPSDTEYVLTGKYYITIKLRKITDTQDVVTTLLPMKEFWVTGTDRKIDTKPGRLDSDDGNESIVIYDGGEF